MGRTPDYLKLVAAAAQLPDGPAGDRCGGTTKSGGTCRRKTGGGRCPQHADQAAPVAGCPVPLTSAQRRLWDDYLPRLEELGLWKPIFWPSLYGLVVALADLELHSGLAAATPAPVKGDNGAPKKHPSATIVNQRLAQVGAYMDRLGLTVAALSRAPGEKPKRSTLDRLIHGGR